MKVLERHRSKNGKVAIVTIIIKNFGNRLQNFALQEALKKLGFCVYTVPYKTGLKTIMKEKLKLLLISFFSYFRYRWTWEYFNRRYIHGTIMKPSDHTLNKRYDYFVAGSDQIWNPLFWINTEREFLTAFDKEKRIAYAASIGIDQLPEECLERYQQYFNGIPNISVREDRAADIIYALTGRKAPVVIDPTMLLTMEEWGAVLHSCKVKTPDRYIVKYILGAKTQEYEKYITDRAMEEGLEIVDLLDEHGFAKRGMGPLEFVYYFANCERSYVDSFHGTVFSILFEKPFVVFERPFEEGAGLMTCRLETLLSTFQLQDRLIRDMVHLERMDHNFDFSKLKDILSAKRREAMNYIRMALHME